MLLTPYPWQWFDIGGGTGAFKALSAVEALLLYAVIGRETRAGELRRELGVDEPCRRTSGGRT